MFLLGLTAGTGAANSSKIFAVWFPQNQMTVAFSIYGGMATVGAIGAMASTPLLLQAGVSISSIFSIGTVAMGICMVGWLVFGRSKPANAPELKTESVMQYMGTVVKNKHLWLENGAMFFFMGSTMACSTFVIPCLTIVKGATFPQAAFWSSMSAVFSMIGTVVLPGLLGKSGYLKRTYIIAAIVAAVIIAIAWALPFSTGSMVLFMIGILIMGCGIPIHKQYPALLKSIPVVAIGSAGGLQSVIQSLGGFLVPSFILGAIATATNNYSAVIFGVAVLMVVSAIFTLGLPEIGAKGNQRKLGDLEAASAEGRS
jgi:nitrate/nitrite transporter NarK